MTLTGILSYATFGVAGVIILVILANIDDTKQHQSEIVLTKSKLACALLSGQTSKTTSTVLNNITMS